MKVFDKTWKLAVAGALVGVLAALLAYFGNPANMAICIACFVRDTAGALKLHSAAPVQYFRPEIVGFAVGAFAISLVTNEYKATAGSSPMIRFVLVCDHGNRRAGILRVSAAYGSAYGSR